MPVSVFTKRTLYLLLGLLVLILIGGAFYIFYIGSPGNGRINNSGIIPAEETSLTRAINFLARVSVNGRGSPPSYTKADVNLVSQGSFQGFGSVNKTSDGQTYTRTVGLVKDGETVNLYITEEEYNTVTVRDKRGGSDKPFAVSDLRGGYNVIVKISKNLLRDTPSEVTLELVD